MSQQRNYYRIRFPVQERPRITAGGAEFHVLDLSEEGARLAVIEPLAASWDSPLAIEISFKDGTTVAAEAAAQREADDYVTIRFTEKLPLSLIIGEQHRLLALYGKDALRSLELAEAAS